MKDLHGIGIAALSAAFATPAGATEPACEQKPNILLIITDQQTASAMSCAGNPDLKTPNMDRLADHGIIFENAYCTAPLSGPSRAAMFTGCYPDEAGLIRNGAPLPDSLKDVTLGSLVKRAGYDCAYAGKWHVPEASIPDGVYGFENCHGHNDRGLAEAVVAYLQEPHSRPFFLVASFDNPHNICEFARSQNLPWGNVTMPASGAYPRLPANFARNADEPDVLLAEQQAHFSLYPTLRYTPTQWRQYRYAYYRLVEKVDAEIGKIVDELNRGDLWKNTLVIFLSDHGDGIGAHHWNQKSALYEEIVNVPLIVCLPTGAGAGTRSRALVSAGIDLYHTICRATGAQAAQTVGVSFLPGDPQRDYVVTETTFDEGTTRGWMLRTRNYKYVLYDKGLNREQLFDMRNDRLERHNLASRKACADTLRSLRALLARWMQQQRVRPTRKHISDIPE